MVLSGGGLEGLTSASLAEGGAPFAGLGIWRYRTETGSPPASNQIRFNNVDPEAATSLFIHDTNAGGTDMGNFINGLASGSVIYIQDRANSANFIIVRISTNVDSTGFHTIGITEAVVEGVVPSQNAQVAVVI